MRTSIAITIIAVICAGCGLGRNEHTPDRPSKAPAQKLLSSDDFLRLFGVPLNKHWQARVFNGDKADTVVSVDGPFGTGVHDLLKELEKAGWTISGRGPLRFAPEGGTYTFTKSAETLTVTHRVMAAAFESVVFVLNSGRIEERPNRLNGTALSAPAVRRGVGNHTKGDWHRVYRKSISSDRSMEDVQ